MNPNSDLFAKIESKTEIDQAEIVSPEDESIDLDELVATFRENMRMTIQRPSKKSDEVELRKTKLMLQKRETRTINDHFEKKIMLDLINHKNSVSKKNKKKTFHDQMLARGLDCGLNGKMVVYEDYHAYNSDDSSNVSDDGNSLFYRYGMGSMCVDDSLKSDLIYRSTKREKEKTCAKKKVQNKKKKSTE